MRLRPASSGDVPELARVQAEAWRVAYRGIVPDRVLASVDEREIAAGWEQLLARLPRGTLVAERNGCVVGLAATGPSRDGDAVPLGTGEVYSLYVEPASWGEGVGERLLKGALQVLLVEEYAEATLWVLRENLRARAFYERAGLVLEAASTRVVEKEGTSLPHVRYRITLG